MNMHISSILEYYYSRITKNKKSLMNEFHIYHRTNNTHKLIRLSHDIIKYCRIVINHLKKKEIESSLLYAVYCGYIIDDLNQIERTVSRFEYQFYDTEIEILLQNGKCKLQDTIDLLNIIRRNLIVNHPEQLVHVSGFKVN